MALVSVNVREREREREKRKEKSVHLVTTIDQLPYQLQEQLKWIGDLSESRLVSHPIPEQGTVLYI